MCVRAGTGPGPVAEVLRERVWCVKRCGENSHILEKVKQEKRDQSSIGCEISNLAVFWQVARDVLALKSWCVQRYGLGMHLGLG